MSLGPDFGSGAPTSARAIAAAGESGEQSPLQIPVVVNWFEELKIKGR